MWSRQCPSSRCPRLYLRSVLSLLIPTPLNLHPWSRPSRFMLVRGEDVRLWNGKAALVYFSVFWSAIFPPEETKFQLIYSSELCWLCIKWIWRHDWSLQLHTQLKQLGNLSLKKFRPERPERDLNPWPLRYQCSALLTELSGQLGADHIVSS